MKREREKKVKVEKRRETFYGGGRKAKGKRRSFVLESDELQWK